MIFTRRQLFIGLWRGGFVYSYLLETNIFRLVLGKVMVAERLEKRLKEVELELNSLLGLKDNLTHELATVKSVQFIVKNRITKSQVQIFDYPVPCFSSVYNFGEWVYNNTDKAWCCWNGALYEAKELAEDRMLLPPVGRYEDVPE